MNWWLLAKPQYTSGMRFQTHHYFYMRTTNHLCNISFILLSQTPPQASLPPKFRLSTSQRTTPSLRSHTLSSRASIGKRVGELVHVFKVPSDLITFFGACDRISFSVISNVSRLIRSLTNQEMQYLVFNRPTNHILCFIWS